MDRVRARAGNSSSIVAKAQYWFDVGLMGFSINTRTKFIERTFIMCSICDERLSSRRGFFFLLRHSAR
jgi:hypothetical protein